jgi:hypothetical protein
MQFLGKSESAVDGKAAKLDQVLANQLFFMAKPSCE